MPLCARWKKEYIRYILLNQLQMNVILFTSRFQKGLLKSYQFLLFGNESNTPPIFVVHVLAFEYANNSFNSWLRLQYPKTITSF